MGGQSYNSLMHPPSLLSVVVEKGAQGRRNHPFLYLLAEKQVEQIYTKLFFYLEVYQMIVNLVTM